MACERCARARERLKRLLMGKDYRSPEARENQKLYKLPAWKALRKQHLDAHPLCARHLERGEVVPATVVHHVKAHKGNMALFLSPTNLESLCKPCHDGPTQKEEVNGYSNDRGPDGWPTDPNHPTNRVTGG
jgi:5-methylcytosine-specific restriction protein A